MLSSHLALLSLVFAVAGLVNAFPLQEDTPTRPSFAKATPTCTQPTLSPDEKKWSSEPFIRDHLPNPLKKLPMFWSGRVGGGSILPYAESCAEKHKGGTVGMMMCEIRGFTMPNITTPSATARWNFASEIFANHTKGRAEVMLGDDVKKDGTWRKIELPALKKNPSVTMVIQLKRTCEDDCYWYCPKPADCKASFAPLPTAL